MRDENGLEKCVACGLCAVACPADAIYLEAAENDGSVQAGPRYAKVYQIHKTRCIFCGYCEEACPVSAIFMGKDYELAVYSNKDFIWDKAGSARPDAPRQPEHRQVDAQSSSSARSATFTATSSACAASCGGIRRAVLALRRRCGGRRRPLRAVRRAALLDQGQQRGLRPRSRRASFPSESVTTSRTAAAGEDRRHPRRRARRHVRADVVRDARRRPAAPAEGHAASDRAGRQAPAFRARGSRGVQGACGTSTCS